MFQYIFSAIGRIISFMSEITFQIGEFSVSLLSIEIASLVLSVILFFVFPQGGGDDE